MIVCQKSKINDWYDHFNDNYKADYVSEFDKYMIYDLTQPEALKLFLNNSKHVTAELAGQIGIINYELVWRRPELLQLKDFTLLLDESSLIQNSTAKRTKFISKLKFTNLILLSGTPCNGKYENLYSQLKLLGYNITKKLYIDTYVNYHYDTRQGFPLMIIDGYKNVERLKRKMREYGCSFLKTEEVMELPEQIFTKVKVPVSSWYKKFMKDRIIKLPDTTELIGDTTLTKLLYARMLCGAYSKSKLDAFRDILESTSDRLIVFYNFNNELDILTYATKDYTDHISVVNGQTKNLTSYKEHSDSVTFIQYQAGAMGLNLQLANKIIYFTPPLSSELYEQSKKRTHRINQKNVCFYYNLVVKGSVEEKIYKCLEMRRDYTDELFREE